MSEVRRVVSWNVGRVYTPSGNNRLADADVPRVAKALREIDADVILLQEIATDVQLLTLLDLLPGYDGQLASQCDYDRHVAALARTSINPTFEQHRLEPTGRGLVALTFDLDPDSRGAAHAVHLDVRQQLRKRSQVEGILKIATNRQEEIAIIGGDFNLDPAWANRLSRWMSVDAASFDQILRAGFVDTGRLAGPTAMRFLFRIDHLFARQKKDAKTLTTHVAHQHRLPIGDHSPVVLAIG